MQKAVRYIFVFLFAFVSINANAQDPHFSQFFSAPLNVNPAMAGDISEDTRISVNYRKQWAGLASPFTTEVFTLDTKVFLNKQSPNFFGIGIMAMGDQAMDGVYRSTYASANLAAHLYLDEDETHRISFAFAGMYGNRIIDYSRLDFANQFASYGFNTNLPTGEMGFSNMKPFTSISAGMLYQYATEQTMIEFGSSAFHLNRPVQSSFEDPLQHLPVRYVLNTSVDQQLNNKTVLNVNAIYQNQAATSYISIGGILGYSLNDENTTMINGGLWYRSNDAIYPYIGLLINKFQFGLTYDVTVSKLKNAPQKFGTFELGMIYRFSKSDDRAVKCPKSFWR